MVGSHGLGSRDFGAAVYVVLAESRIRTLANVTDGRFNVDGSFALVLLFSRFDAVAICVLFDDLASDVVFAGDFFDSAVSFDNVSLVGASQRLE